jgi:hypothetical protein
MSWRSIEDKQSRRANDFAQDIQSRLLIPQIARETPSKKPESSVCPSLKLAPNATGVNGRSIFDQIMFQS